MQDDSWPQFISYCSVTADALSCSFVKPRTLRDLGAMMCGLDTLGFKPAAPIDSHGYIRIRSDGLVSVGTFCWLLVVTLVGSIEPMAW